MLEPKKQRRSLADEKYPTKYCENPMCGHKLPMRRARRGAKYCDTKCHREHQRILGMEKRPAVLLCDNCGERIDTEKRKASSIEQALLHFCDLICADEYRRKQGVYKAISQQGTKEAKAYKEKHGRVHSHAKRSKAVAANNSKAPPKNKNFDRVGHAWGYDVYFEGTGVDYIVTVPEIPEIVAFHSVTMKAGLRMVRAKMLDIRRMQRNTKGEVDGILRNHGQDKDRADITEQ